MRTLLCFGCLLFLLPLSYSQTRTQSKNTIQPPGNEPKQGPTVQSVSELIKVTIYPSRSEVVPNGSYGIYSDFENISSIPVLIFPNQTALVVLPEAAEPSSCVDWEPGIFPTEIGAKGTSEPSKVAYDRPDDPWYHPLVIAPGEHYKVFWDLEPDKLKQKAKYNGDCKLPNPFFSALGFVPGDYAFAVEGNAYVETDVESSSHLQSVNSVPPQGNIAGSTQSVDTKSSEIAKLIADAQGGKLPAHHFSEIKTLRVGISQITTLLAAMLGGFIAYWVVNLREKRDWDAFMDVISSVESNSKKVLAGLSLLRNAVSAAVLGGVVTIVSSRLSDTHFPVKVSVSDFWGALTIGFVAYFIGNKFIESLANLGGTDNTSTLGKRNPSNRPSGEGAPPQTVTSDMPSAATQKGIMAYREFDFSAAQTPANEGEQSEAI